ncbi:MAG: hypothetical protein ACRBCS_13360 [Cellvibrionaceae bacterium]
MISILYQHKFGGTDLLLQRMESWLKNNNYVVTDEKSAVKEKVNLDLIVVPTSEMHRLYHLKRKGLKFKKLLVWSMGHGALKAAFYNNRFENFLYGIPKYGVDFFIRKFSASLIETNSILFTDKVGLLHDLKGIDLRGVNLDELLCPIAIKNYGEVPTSRLNKSNIVFGWIGRISHDFKLLPLKKILRDLEAIGSEQNRTFRMIIVGDGDGAKSLEIFLPSVGNINVEWIKEVKNDQILKFIDEEIDVLFAMGTSALDGANTSTPTVIVQPFSIDKEEPSKAYRWIFESIGFSLGEFVNIQVEPIQVSVDLKSIVSDIEIQGLDEISKQCRKYSISFHEDNVFNKIFPSREINDIGVDTLRYLSVLSFLYNTKIFLKNIFALLWHKSKILK